MYQLLGENMKNIVLRNYQSNAIESIMSSIEKGKNRILIDMPAGTGKSIILIDLLDRLITEAGNILVVVTSLAEKEYIRNQVVKYDSSRRLENELGHKICLVNYQLLRNQWSKFIEREYAYVFILGAEKINNSDIFNYFDSILIGFRDITQTTKRKYSNQAIENKLFEEEDCVYSYTKSEAVEDGILSPQIEPKAYEKAAIGFCKRLFAELGCQLINEESIFNKNFSRADIILNFDNKKIFVNCKLNRSEFFTQQSLNVAISQMKLFESYNNVDIVMLIVFGKVEENYKETIYNEHKIVVWDISNLLFYVQHNDKLYEELSILSYYPLSGINAAFPIGWSPLKKVLDYSPRYIQEKVDALKKRINECEIGKKGFVSYEEICQSIIQFLFPHAFYIISDQHKTDDKHFRMDLLCSLRGDSEHSHEFWKILSRHYNSHFIVFEFKNYNKPIEQNLIYITEKYLFNAALRNVAIVISRKGFSDGACFAAKGCLKENGKLILSLTDSDLINMLDGKLDSKSPEDYLLSVFEKFLMGISK